MIEEVAGAREQHVADHAERDVLVAVALAHAAGHVDFVQLAHQLLVRHVAFEQVVVGVAWQAQPLAEDVTDRGLIGSVRILQLEVRQHVDEPGIPAELAVVDQQAGDRGGEGL